MNKATENAIGRLTNSAWMEETIERLVTEIESAVQREYEVAATCGASFVVDVNATALAIAELMSSMIIAEITPDPLDESVLPEAETMTFDQMETMIEMCPACSDGRMCETHDELIDGERMFPWAYCDHCDLYRRVDHERSGTSLGFAGGYVSFLKFVGCDHMEVDESDDVRAAR